ncbi:MAG: V-type ATP synthase subunit I [Treponema sp.]|nr:V-type ATP synthase subunit I [Treponema sp.]
MKCVQMTVLKSDINTVIEYLGRNKVMHFDLSDNPSVQSTDYTRMQKLWEKLCSSSEFLGVQLPSEPAQNTSLPGEEDEALAEKLCASVDALIASEIAAHEEKRRTEEAYGETKAFINLNAPFSELEQLTYLNLRVGRLDPRVHAEIKERLGDRVMIIPLGGEGRVLAASSRKGRFALDSELKKYAFESIAIPEGYMGVPAELLDGLEQRLKNIEQDIEIIAGEKQLLQNRIQTELQRLGSMLLMALAAENLKSQLVSTSSAYLMTGWIPSDTIPAITKDITDIAGGRVAIRTYSPDEIPGVKDGDEKVPVALKHNPFAKGFEGVVTSYGAPLYGTIDPTPIVAVFFTMFFGIMFGDLGQGFVLFLLGLLTGNHGPRLFTRFKKFSVPLIAVGIASMVMGFLNGEVFTNEELLITPTRAITGAITGQPVDRIISIMPLTERGGSVRKLFYFFGFTIGMGIIFNSIGFVINIVNKFILKKFDEALFAKTGLTGLLLFWYAVSIAIRLIFFNSRFEWFDLVILLIPCCIIFFRPVIWRCAAGERPLLKNGLVLFIVEGFVEIIETASGYVSSTVSFLRIGAFALSHAVLAYIVFSFTELVINTAGGPMRAVSVVLIMIFGNMVIIVLEGLIVAIQVVRLQYYEFFSKFFTDTGMEFIPFSFRKSE